MISTTTTINTGETAYLVCVAPSDQDITWMRNGAPVANNSLLNNYEVLSTAYTVTVKSSFLRICGTNMSDAGQYTCMVGTGIFAVSATVQLNVNG